MRAVIQNRDTRFPTEVEWDSGFLSKIETIPPNSGRLDTLQGFLGLQTAGNALKLSILPSPC